MTETLSGSATGRLAITIGRTFALAFVLVSVPLLASTRIPALFAGAELLGWEPVLVPLLIVWGMAAAASLDAFVGSALTKRRIVSLEGVTAVLAGFTERTLFGIGAQRSWTTHNPLVSLGDVIIPETRAHAPKPRATDLVGSASLAPTTQAVTPPTVQNRWTSFETITISRGDTWWSLAEEHAGSGQHWAEIRDLNRGRVAAAGVVIEDSTTLQSGFTVVVPVGAQPSAG